MPRIDPNERPREGSLELPREMPVWTEERIVLNAMFSAEANSSRRFLDARCHRSLVRCALGLSVVVGAGLTLAIPASGQQAESAGLKASHERLPAAEQSTTQTDEMGVWVPVPVNHPARRFPATDEFPTGPAVGERLPSFVLPDQSGQKIRFPDALAGRKALVVFQRSAVW